MNQTFLVITSIADDRHPVLNQYAKESAQNGVSLIIIGDKKSPGKFSINGGKFLSLEDQAKLNLSLVTNLPQSHYSRKNLGYLLAMQGGATCIMETDDDNIPFPTFWNNREREFTSYLIENQGWVNVYRYFTDKVIWPRGFPLDRVRTPSPKLERKEKMFFPIKQGLSDDNPDVDAVYRLTKELPVTFNKHESIAIGKNTFCPFNSQNTTWFKEAFLLMYLPSYCSFRMTDIWRSFVAQRIAWTCCWPILFHQSTVWQERNDHNLMHDFKDEISGYLNNESICENLRKLDLKEGQANIADNLMSCYEMIVGMDLLDARELELLKCWISDVQRAIG